MARGVSSHYCHRGVSLTGSAITRRLLCTCLIYTHVYTHAILHRNSSPTLEITFATYCGNSSHYDESWIAFFLFTQEIPAGSKYSGDATWNRNKLRALKTSKMNIWTEIKHVYMSGYLRNKIEIFSLLCKLLRAKRKTVSMYFMFLL